MTEPTEAKVTDEEIKTVWLGTGEPVRAEVQDEDDADDTDADDVDDTDADDTGDTDADDDAVDEGGDTDTADQTTA
jgi:hypothetical protein